MLDKINDKLNKSVTENGSAKYLSTSSKVLDLFALGGSYRNRTNTDIERLVLEAMQEDELLTLRTLFYLRDIRNGQGERRFFRVALNFLAKNYKDVLLKNIHLIGEYGRYDDLVGLIANENVKREVCNYIVKKLAEDLMIMHNDEIKNKNISLIGKWLPSVNSKNKNQREIAIELIKEMYGCKFATNNLQRQYRKTLACLRKQVDIIETKLTEKRYSDIKYENVPSKAMNKYNKAFYRNDEERFTQYIDDVKNGVKTINASTLYPYEIVAKAMELSGSQFWNGYGLRDGYELNGKTNQSQIDLLESQWNNLPDFIGSDNSKSLAVVDVSGSMMGRPMEVALSLGMYLAERIKNEVFKNHFITFSGKPQLVKIVGNDIVEKVKYMRKADWAMNTDLDKVLELILNTAKENSIDKSEMIENLYIISDMEIDYCVSRNKDNAMIVDFWKEQFNKNGYELPQIIFWNVDARNDTLHAKKDSANIQLLSGFSPSIFKTSLKMVNSTPYEMMLEVVNSERYQAITI